MSYPKTILMCFLAFVLAGTLTSVIFAQTFDLEMSELDESDSLYRAKLTLSPLAENVTQPDGSIDSEDSSSNIHTLAFEFTVQLGQSNTWLLEDDPDRQLTEEEVYARDLFLARRGATSISDLRDYVDDEYYRVYDELYARDEAARNLQLSAFRNFTDVRLLGVIRYGDFYLFLNTIENPSETHPEIQAGFPARKHEGRYLQTDSLRFDIAAPYFYAGRIQEEIYARLEEFVQ